MAIPFKEPEPRLMYASQNEIDDLDAHFSLRDVPQSQDNRLLIATWNIANLGAQDRPPRALRVIAHILSRFDLIAVQEVNDNYWRVNVPAGLKKDLDSKLRKLEKDHAILKGIQ